MTPIILNKDFFADNRNETGKPPMANVNLNNGVVLFNMAATSKYNLLQYETIAFLKYPNEDDVIYFAGTPDPSDGFVVSQYDPKTVISRTYSKVNSKHLATFVASVYRVPMRIVNFKFYIHATKHVFKGNPVYALVLVPVQGTVSSKSNRNKNASKPKVLTFNN